MSTGSLQIVDSVREDQGKFECVSENSVGTEHSKPTQLYVKERRVPPTFSRLPEPINEIMLGANLSLECVAVGSPMPYVRWKSGAADLTPEDQLPVGKNEHHKYTERKNYISIHTTYNLHNIVMIN